jgi:hypothetical protein
MVDALGATCAQLRYRPIDLSGPPASKITNYDLAKRTLLGEQAAGPMRLIRLPLEFDTIFGQCQFLRDD